MIQYKMQHTIGANIAKCKQKKKLKARLYCFNYKDEMMHNFIKIKDISHMWEQLCINTGL